MTCGNGNGPQFFASYDRANDLFQSTFLIEEKWCHCHPDRKTGMLLLVVLITITPHYMCPQDIICANIIDRLMALLMLCSCDN